MAVKFRDYYETLGVKREATQDEIRTAFRKLARKYHPDVAEDKTHAEEKFKEINEAYEVLSDEEKRQKYDSFGANWESGQEFRPPNARRGGPTGGFDFGGGQSGGVEFGGTGFSDFFEQFFGGGRSNTGFGGFSTAGGSAAGVARRGRDVEADIMVTLEEAMNGSRRTITLRRDTGGPQEAYDVRIPPGVREGQRIRLAGQGEGGRGGGTAGDLFLRVRLSKHPDFRVEDPDLSSELILAPWEAMNGCQVKVPTLTGAVSLKIPAGTQSGRKMRLKGQGLTVKGGGRGNLIVEILIHVPTRPEGRERELWEELESISSFRPRN